MPIAPAFPWVHISIHYGATILNQDITTITPTTLSEHLQLSFLNEFGEKVQSHQLLDKFSARRPSHWSVGDSAGWNTPEQSGGRGRENEMSGCKQ